MNKRVDKFSQVGSEYIAHESNRANEGNDKDVILLLIDPQVDFHEQNEYQRAGSLAVPNSDKDSKQIAKMIESNLDKIDKIIVTMDSHHQGHIAHAAFWRRAKNDNFNHLTNIELANHINRTREFLPKARPAILSEANPDMEKLLEICKKPQPFEVLKSSTIGSEWIPRDITLTDYCVQYTQNLENLNPKRTLTIWPEHCLVGSEGHAVVEVINRALAKWCEHHMDRDVVYIHKGMNCLTEMYSAVKADVPNTDEKTMENKNFLDMIRICKRLIIGGQARSHCVNFTTRNIIEDWKKDNMNLERIYLLQDGCSDVYGCAKAGNAFVEFLGSHNIPTDINTNNAFHNIPTDIDTSNAFQN